MYTLLTREMKKLARNKSNLHSSYDFLCSYDCSTHVNEAERGVFFKHSILSAATMLKISTCMA